MRTTPSSRGSHFGIGSMRMRRRNGTWKASWSAPPANTAQASAMIGRSKYGAAKRAKPMKERFSSTGVKAGTLNEPQVLRSPTAKLVSEMKKMYGKQILSIVTVSANLSASLAKPDALA